MKLKIVIAVTLLMFVSGCASIFCGDSKTINISSKPTAANFEITDRKNSVLLKGITPANVTLKRGGGWFKQAGYLITFQKEGYRKITTTVNQELETGWYFSNLIFVVGSPVGMIIIDPLTGAMWNIDDVSVNLKPI